MSKKKKSTKKQAAQRGTKADARRATARQQPSPVEPAEQPDKGYGKKALLVIVVLVVLWAIQRVIGS